MKKDGPGWALLEPLVRTFKAWDSDRPRMAPRWLITLFRAPILIIALAVAGSFSATRRRRTNFKQVGLMSELRACRRSGPCQVHGPSNGFLGAIAMRQRLFAASGLVSELQSA